MVNAGQMRTKNMEYNERINLITQEVINLLRIYAPPKHLDTQSKEADAIKRMAESLNKVFPSDTNADHIKGSFERAGLSILSKHKGNTWPASSDITKAVIDGMGREVKETVPTRSMDPFQINAARIKNREYVGELWIAGRVCAELINKQLVTKADVEPYRKAYYSQLKAMYGKDYAIEYFKKRDAEFAEASCVNG